MSAFFPLVMCLCALGFAVPCGAHSADDIVIGTCKYSMFQNPMLSYWDFGQDSLGVGTRKMPQLEQLSSVNAKGFEAEWCVRNGKLYLTHIKGRVDGKWHRDQKLMPECKFPVYADWFSGNLHLPVGEFADGMVCEIVMTVCVEKGIVKNLSVSQNTAVVITWDGR